MMNWLLLILSLSHSLLAAPLQERKIDPSALSQLVSTLGLDGSNLIAETQKHWLRKPGQERWEMSELPPEQRCFVLNWAEEEGFYAAWKPISQDYDKALLLGATTSRMELRLDYLVRLWNEGIRFKEIVWLTGDRPLDKRVDGLTDRFNTESEAAHILWEEANLPAAMRALPLLFVATPMKGNGRPNTKDTLITWLKTAPEPCKALFISNQPFCGYQYAVVKAHLPNAFLFDVVGEGANPINDPQAASVSLDTIARWLYQDSLRAP